MTDFSQRDAQLDTWLSQVFVEKSFNRERLLGDASFRGYHRLTVNYPNNPDFVEHFVVMDAPPDKESVKEFIAVDRLMSDFVHVPALIAIDEPQGFIVLEDLGGVDFADVITPDDMTTTNQRYQQAMNTILDIQQISTHHAKTVIPPYNDELLRREMRLFDEWYLPYIGVKLDKKTQQLWNNVQQAIIDQVTAQPQVVVHRDFHSRNLMITPNDLGVIDFQDAVVGAYSYDIVSLLRDAYVNWSEEQTLVWFNDFYKMLENIYPELTHNQYMLDVMTMGLQRHLKILGIFVRLYQRDEKARYLANLPRVLQDTLTESQFLANTQGGVFAEFNNFLQTTVAPAFNKVQ